MSGSIIHADPADPTNMSPAGIIEWQKGHVFSLTSADLGDITATGEALATAASVAAAQAALGLGSLATQNGTFSGTSSGTNTGDQTITLTGDVTGSGEGSFATTLGTVPVAKGGTGATAKQAAASNLAVPFILQKTSVPVSATNDTNEDTVSTITLPAMNPNAIVDLEYLMTNNNSADNKVFKLYLGGGPGVGTQIWTRTMTTATSLTLKLKIGNVNATNSQAISGYSFTSSGTITAPSALTAAVQTSAGTTIVMTAQKSTVAGSVATCAMAVATLLDDGT